MHKEIHFVTADEAVKVVKSGDHIHLSSVASAPRILIEALCRRGEAGDKAFTLNTNSFTVFIK